jgi:KaiC/GvpD/RAD55 family RecA-like ATPase
MSDGQVPIFGISEIDSVIQAALPAGWLGLIEGTTGAGGHLLAKQAAHAAAGAMPVFYYATHESAAEVERTFREFGWDPGPLHLADLDHELFASTRLREIEVYQARGRGLKLAEVTGGVTVAVRPPIPSLTGRLMSDVSSISTAFRFVVDSLDLLFELLRPEELTTLARQIRHRAYAQNGGVLFALRPEVPDARSLALLEEISDFIVRLDLPQEGERFLSQIALVKVRNHPERTRVFRGAVTEHGLEARL